MFLSFLRGKDQEQSFTVTSLHTLLHILVSLISHSPQNHFWPKWMLATDSSEHKSDTVGQGVKNFIMHYTSKSQTRSPVMNIHHLPYYLYWESINIHHADSDIALTCSAPPEQISGILLYQCTTEELIPAAG